MPRLKWDLSRVKVEPVTEQAAKAAVELLKGAAFAACVQVRHRRHVTEVTLRQPKPVALLTSDSEDIAKLCGDQVRVIPL